MDNKVKINLEKYLTHQDRLKVKEIKIAVLLSNDIDEIKKYEAHMKYFMKKAYIRMQMGIELNSL